MSGIKSNNEVLQPRMECERLNYNHIILKSSTDYSRFEYVSERFVSASGHRSKAEGVYILIKKASPMIII